MVASLWYRWSGENRPHYDDRVCRFLAWIFAPPPDRVAIPQEEVIAYVYQGMREKLIASGKVPPELLKKLKEAEAADAEDDMTFEEGIEQLRQEGTDMGGSDYEVTLEDIKEKEDFNEEEYNTAKHDSAETEAAEKKTEAETNTKK